MGIRALLRSFEEYFDNAENQSTVHHVVIWSLFVATTGTVLAVIQGDPLAIAVQVGAIAGTVTLVVLAVGMAAWQYIQPDTTDER